MSRKRQLLPAQPFAGFNGVVDSIGDFAKCGSERRLAIMAALTRLMERYGENLNRAEARLAEAQAEIADERAFLAGVMPTYIEFTQVIAAQAAQAIEATPAAAPAEPGISGAGQQGDET